MTIFLVQLEPLEERYTKQWAYLFPQACEKIDLEYEVITGQSLGGEVGIGTVLDAHGTNYYKASQLQQLILYIKLGRITSDDMIFFYDLWFPGLEMLQYIADLTGVKPFVAGFLHAGTWTEGDFNQKFLPWGRLCERVWIDIADYIVVASDYHRNRILRAIEDKCDDKIDVLGAPVAYKEIAKAKEKFSQYRRFSSRNYDVIWPHRFDTAKRPDILWEIAAKMPSTRFLVTSSRRFLTNDSKAHDLLNEKKLGNVSIKIQLSKKEYYEQLWDSKVVLSTSPEESWGYGVIEGICAECYPVVPNTACHREHVLNLTGDPIIQDMLLYPFPQKQDIDAIVERIEFFLYQQRLENRYRFIESLKYNAIRIMKHVLARKNRAKR